MQAEIDDAGARLARYFGILDGELAKRPYLAADQLTMGDIPLGMTTYRYFNLPMARPKLSNVEAWYARLVGRPAFRTHVMIPLT